jgi:hypothetical protein
MLSSAMHIMTEGVASGVGWGWTGAGKCADRVIG